MTSIRCLSLLLCASATVVLPGCDDNLNSEPPGPPPPASAVSQGLGAASTESPAITVTPRAAAAIRRVVADLPDASKLDLRLRAVPGGCLGFLYRLNVELRVSPGDQVFESEGLHVVTSRRQAEMLKGTRIDFGEEHGEQGFKIDSPNFKGESAERWLAALAMERELK